MSVNLTVPRKVVLDALNRAFPVQANIEEVSTVDSGGGVTDVMSDWAYKISQRIRDAVSTLLENGEQALTSTKEAVLELISQVRKEAGNQFPKVASRVLEQIREFEDTLLQGALENRAKRRMIDGREFGVASFSITEKLAITTNVEVSVIRLLKLAATGELSFTLQFEPVA